MKGQTNGLRKSATKIPTEIQPLCPPPQLLPGESIEQYREVQAAIFEDIKPQSAIEWLLATDIAELSWEMQRYRMLRQRLLAAYRQKAIQAALRRVDLAGIAPELTELAEVYTLRNALDWQLDPSAALHIEARLNSHGFDQHALNSEVYIQAREDLSLFEALLNGAQLRRLLLLKELIKMRYHRQAGTRRALNSSDRSTAQIAERSNLSPERTDAISVGSSADDGWQENQLD